MSSVLTREFRNYLLETRKSQAAIARNTIYKKLSPALGLKASKVINHSLMQYQCFSRVKRLPKGEAFVSAIVMATTPKVFVPKEDVPTGFFYLITQGSVKRLGNILSPGDYFGDADVILSHPRESPSACLAAFATTYLHVQAIGRNEFQKLKNEYPVEYAASTCPQPGSKVKSAHHTPALSRALPANICMPGSLGSALLAQCCARCIGMPFACFCSRGSRTSRTR